MTAGLPSATPENPGGNEAAANAADNQCNVEPKEKAKPRKREVKKWFGLTEAKWRELLAIVMLIPWVWVEMLDCQNLAKLCLLAITLVVAQFVVFSFFRDRYQRWTFALWLISLIPVGGVVWENSRPMVDPKSYELLSPTLATNIVKTLTTSRDRINPTGILIFPVNPDSSAYAFSRQLEQIFQDGGCQILVGEPPSEIPEVPGVSCFFYGNACTNSGLIRALSMVVTATKSSAEIELSPRPYPNTFVPLLASTNWSTSSPPTPQEMADSMNNAFSRPFPTGLVVIIIRAK
jgi:hypothetical protein